MEETSLSLSAEELAEDCIIGGTVAEMGGKGGGV